jgi:hypothetical protein
MKLDIDDEDILKHYYKICLPNEKRRAHICETCPFREHIYKVVEASI